MFNIFVAAALVLYPVLVFFGLGYFSIQTLVMVLAALLLLRHWHAKKTQQASLPGIFPLVMLGGSLLLLSLSAITDNLIGMRLYPVWINLSLLAVFAFSLIHPPTIIERFARLTEPNLTPFALTYIRRVTQMWCGFFFINASIAFYTAVFCSLATWTWYNGMASYLAIGLLFAIEFIVRQWLKKRDPDHV
ncbi:hypothetical protein [Motilimonas cestriensis]|uniref:hypothetical protein n=1 Tax=Motilimonas cestriensis TaxID=2742685 RepID=UPI003DA28763